MFSVPTAEIRWFFRGNIPENMIRWLASQNGTWEDLPPRSDLYLVLPGQDNLGIKLREGRIEIKKRVTVHDHYKAPGMSGRVESWNKWSFKVEEEFPGETIGLQETSQWIGIQKKRYLHKHEIGPEGDLMPHRRKGFPPKGIALELSDLIVRDTTWWTLGLECFGNATEIYGDLLRFIPLLTIELPAAELSIARSSGYPGWIDTIKG